MEKPDQKVGKVFLVFAGICIAALPFIVLAAMSYEPAPWQAVGDWEESIPLPDASQIDGIWAAIAADYESMANRERDREDDIRVVDPTATDLLMSGHDN